MPIQSQWKNEDRLNEAIALWKKGVTAQQGADILGVSRSAFLGIIHRLKKQNVVQGRHSTFPMRKSPKRRKIYDPSAHITSAFTHVPNTTIKPPRCVEQIPVEDLGIPVAQLKTIATLSDNDCRWPIGDPQTPEFRLCGGEKVPGRSYCPSHLRRSIDSPVIVASISSATEQTGAQINMELVDAY